MAMDILRFVALKIPPGANLLHDAGALHALGKAANEVRRAFRLIFLDPYIHCHSGGENTMQARGPQARGG